MQDLAEAMPASSYRIVYVKLLTWRMSWTNLTAEAAKIAGVQDVVSQRVSLDSHQVSMQ